MRSWFRSVFSPSPIMDSRRTGFLAWTAFLLITLLFLFGVTVWMSFQPEARAQIAAAEEQVLGYFAFIAAIALAAQLTFTTSKGFVYCGTREVVRKSDDLLIYRVYCLFHCLVIAVLAVMAYLWLR